MGHGLRRTAFDRSSYDFWTGKYGVINVKDYGAVGDGVHDDTQAIQDAFNSMGPQPTGKLYFPRGTYKISHTLDFNLGHFEASYDGNVQVIAGAFAIEMDGVLSPQPGIGSAIFIYSGYYPHIQVKAYGGGQNGDKLVKAEDLLGPYFDISAQLYMGTLLYSDGSGVPNATGTLRCTLVNGGRVIAEHCGQALSLANYGGFGTLDSIWDDTPSSGSVINNFGDLTIFSYENAINASLSTPSLLINSSYSIHLDKVAIGTSSPIEYLLEILNCNVDNFATGVAINELFIQGGGQAQVGLWANNSGVYIFSFTGLSCLSGALAQDGGSVSVQSFYDNGSTTGIEIGDRVANAAGDTAIGWFYSHSAVQSALIVGSGVVGGSLHIGAGVIYNPNTAGGAYPSIQILGPEKCYLGSLIDASKNSAGSLIIPDASNLFLNAYGQTLLANGITYTSTGPLSTLAGTTAGTVYWRQDVDPTASIKRFVAYCDGYENDTTTNQTITFPTVYKYNPAISTNTTELTLSASTSALTITAPDSTSAYSGVIEIVGI